MKKIVWPISWAILQAISEMISGKISGTTKGTLSGTILVQFFKVKYACILFEVLNKKMFVVTYQAFP